jgi:hypothetical protein
VPEQQEGPRQHLWKYMELCTSLTALMRILK